ncbi:hypothetical protein TNCV_257821 [Trichonephila clavipes]|uniref:Uncharacterized protein n=1 Tax=Trichonephila clavipes TaxID=2585209 RepID=A0A8X6RRN6_TRICX|nr:hypothetical protein TNCV_257821 [Trichonephila clavipes]
MSYFRSRGLDCCIGSSSTLDLKIRSPSTTALRSMKKLLFYCLQKTESAVHETTGCSPSQMFFGRDLRLPAYLLFSQPPDAPLAPCRETPDTDGEIASFG